MPSRFRHLALLAPFALLLCWVSLAFGGDPAPEFRVIAHPTRQESSVTREFLADAFLKNVTRWSGDQTIHPVDQRPDSSARRRFSEAVLKRSVQAVKSHWQQRIFSGRGVPPPELESDDAVVRFVETRPGAVGYVSGSAPIGKARVLAVKP